MDWQPIDSAPKDGADVLLWTDTRACSPAKIRPYLLAGGEHFAQVQIGFWTPDCDAPMRKEAAHWVTEKIGEPTHWMPLPAPPA